MITQWLRTRAKQACMLRSIHNLSDLSPSVWKAKSKNYVLWSKEWSHSIVRFGMGGYAAVHRPHKNESPVKLKDIRPCCLQPPLESRPSLN